MTDRVNAFIVILEKDIREDNEATINAIRQIRGVLDVKPHIANIDESIAESRVRVDLMNKLFQLLRDE